MDRIRISYLAEHQEHLPTIARWLADEWPQYLPDEAPGYVMSMLESRLNLDRIPLCLVAIKENSPVGTVSLKVSDMDIRSHLSPWLASLYVDERHRNIGIGKKLVRELEKKAIGLGLKSLFLFTPSARSFYEKLGWLHYENLHYKNSIVDIMKRDLAP